MSILIKGMEMPENCDACLFDDGVHCMAYPQSEDMVYDIADGKPNWCPLIPVTPHGRLIDADDFDKRIRLAGGTCEEELTEDFKDGIQTVLAMMKTQLTIIPAEEVYGQYTDTAGNFHWCGTHSGEHIIKAEECET